MDKIVCPVCGTSDFKEENGYNVCQICGHKIELEKKEEPKGAAAVLNKGTDKIISLIFFGYMSASILLAILPNLRYYLSGANVGLLIMNAICVGPMLAMLLSTVKSMKGKGEPTEKFKKFCFFYYLIGRIGGIILTVVMGRQFAIAEILYAAFYCILVWFVLFRLNKIKKQ